MLVCEDPPEKVSRAKKSTYPASFHLSKKRTTGFASSYCLLLCLPWVTLPLLSGGGKLSLKEIAGHKFVQGFWKKFHVTLRDVTLSTSSGLGLHDGNAETGVGLEPRLLQICSCPPQSHLQCLVGKVALCHVLYGAVPKVVLPPPPYQLICAVLVGM